MPNTSRPLAWLLGSLIAIAVLATYANSLPVPFLFDDVSTVVGNTTIRTVSVDALRPPANESSTAGRPLVNLSFALNYAAGGLTVTGYHIVNIALHLMCALLVFALARHAFAFAGIEDPAATLAAGALALVWAVHPLNTGTVTYISARSELLMAACYLIVMVAAAAAHNGRVRLRMAVAVVACAAGMACKESMVTAPVAVLLFDRAYIYPGFADAFRRRAGFYGSLAATWGVLLVVLWNAPHSASAGFGKGVSIATYLLNQAVIIPEYLRLAVWPDFLLFAYGEVHPLSAADVGLVGVVVPVLIAATAWLWLRRPAVGFPAVWVLLTLAPTSSIVPIVTEAGAARRMYLPLIGLAALATIAGLWLLRRLSRRAVPVVPAAALAVAIVAAALATETVVQNREFSSPEQLWRGSLARWPSATAHRNLATTLKQMGKRDEVVEHLRAAAATFPEERYTLGVELIEEGRSGEAIPELQRAVAEQADNRTIAIDGRYALARAYREQGRAPDAAAAYAAILQLAPGDTRAMTGRADALLAGGDFAAAHREYQQVLAITPEAVNVLTNDGIALLQMGRPADALSPLQRVAASEPQNASAQVNLAAALAGAGQLAQATDVACRALALSPGDSHARELTADIRAVAAREHVRVRECDRPF